MTSAAALLRTPKGTPNVALWGRDGSDRVTGLASAGKYNSLYGAHSKFIVLDCLITNNGAAVATFTLDGVLYSISAGQLKSFTNHPWTEFEAISATDLMLEMDGILYDSAEQLGFINRSGGFNEWQ